MQVITTDITEDEWRRLWATNVAGTFSFSKRLARLINEGKRQHSDDPSHLSVCQEAASASIRCCLRLVLDLIAKGGKIQAGVSADYWIACQSPRP